MFPPLAYNPTLLVPPFIFIFPDVIVAFPLLTNTPTAPFAYFSISNCGNFIFNSALGLSTYIPTAPSVKSSSPPVLLLFAGFTLSFSIKLLLGV